MHQFGVVADACFEAQCGSGRESLWVTCKLCWDTSTWVVAACKSKEGLAYLTFDLRFGVFQFGAALCDGCVSLLDVPGHPTTLPDGHSQVPVTV